jgi:hypothetical protein
VIVSDTPIPLRPYVGSLRPLMWEDNNTRHQKRNGTTALPSALVTSLTVYSLFGLSAAVSTLTFRNISVPV